MSRNRVAVIIMTFNEELNLAAALDSVAGWADEVFVVDSYSTDKTIDVALQPRTGVKVHIVQHPFEDYAKQWNWALTNLPISAEWTLKLDADERVTKEFRNEVDSVIASATEGLHGLLFRRRLYFLGAPLRFGGVRGNYDLRLWRTGRASFEDRPVNEHALVSGQVFYLKSYVEHHDYKSLTDWLDKHNRYASLEAISFLEGNVTGDYRARFFGSPIERRMWLRKVYGRVPCRHILLFLFRYLVRGGFLDGRAGFRYAFLHTMVFYWIDLKMVESQDTGRRPAVYWPPRGFADKRLVAESDSATESRAA